MERALGKRQDSAKSYDRVVRTTCSNFCNVGCGMKVFVDSGRIVDIYGDEEHPINKGSLCPRGSAAYQEVYNPKRLTRPLVRTTLNDGFRETSWDEALSIVASRLRAVREEHGPAAVHIHLGRQAGFGSMALGERFGELFGASNFGGFSPPIGRTAADAGAGVFGSGLLMNPPQDWQNSDSILVIGSGLSSEVILAGWIMDARERGTEVIWIATTRTPLTAKATMPLVVRPGSEVAVLMTMLNVIIGEGLYDAEFVRQWVRGLDELRDICREYKPERVQDLSWIPADAIKLAARTIAERHPCQVVGGLANPYAPPSFDLALASAALVSLTGSIGVKGGGWNWLWCGQPPFAACADLVASGLVPQDRLKVDGRDYTTARALIVDGGFPADPSAISAMEDTRRNSLLTMVLSTAPEDGHRFAHVVLPITTWLEEDGLVYHTHNRSLQWQNRVVSPPADCRSAVDFWGALAREFGWGEMFPWVDANGTVDQRRLADHFLRQQPLVAGCSVDAIDPEKNPPGGIMWPCAVEEEARQEEGATIRGKWILHRMDDSPTGTGQQFGTPNGKIELPVEELRRFAREHLEFEKCSADLARRFPLVLATARFQAAFGEDPGRWPWTAAGNKGAVVHAHPMVAAVARLKAGELAVLESGEASIEARVVTDTTLDPRCVWLPADFSEGGAEGDGRGETSRLGFVWRHEGARVRLYKKGGDPDATTELLVEALRRDDKAPGSPPVGFVGATFADRGGHR